MDIKVKESIFSELIGEGIISAKDNRLRILDSIDMTTYGSNGWACILQMIGKRKGEDYLRKLGYIMGEDSARQILEVLEKKRNFVTPKIGELATAMQIAGFGVVSIIEESNKIKVTVEKNTSIDFGKRNEKEGSMVCDFYSGAYGAIISVFRSRNIELKHTSCICRNDNRCVFEGSA